MNIFLEYAKASKWNNLLRKQVKIMNPFKDIASYLSSIMNMVITSYIQ